MIDEELTAKLKDNIQNCPVCGSTELYSDDLDGDQTLSIRETCGECGATWYEHYKFQAAGNLREGSN